MLKHDLTRILSAREEAFCVTTLTAIQQFFMTKSHRMKNKASIDYVDPCVKKQLIWLRTLGEEAFGVTLPK